MQRRIEGSAYRTCLSSPFAQTSGAIEHHQATRGAARISKPPNEAIGAMANSGSAGTDQSDSDRFPDRTCFDHYRLPAGKIVYFTKPQTFARQQARPPPSL
jgi:hypothetical protein